MTTERWPVELTGARDFEYIRPAARRLTEYEAVTCYTQPSPHSGGLQAPGDFMLRPDGRPIFDPASTRLQCDDWFAFRDPNRLWQRHYYTLQAGAERAIDVATNTAIDSGLVRQLDGVWLENGLRRAYFPFAHLEYGLFRSLNIAARESLSDTVNNVLAFNAADKLRHAQAICLLGLDLEAELDGFEALEGREVWLKEPEWQPVRRVIEEIMALTDWCEAVVAVNLALEPLLAEPLRQQVFTLTAAQRGDVVAPVVAGSARADWLRNTRWTEEFLRFLVRSDGGKRNADLLLEWNREWTSRVRPVAEGIFESVAGWLDDAGIVPGAAAVAKTQEERTARWRPDIAGRLTDETGVRAT